MQDDLTACISDINQVVVVMAGTRERAFPLRHVAEIMRLLPIKSVAGTPVLALTDIEQFRTMVTCHLGLQFEDAKLDYLAGVVRQRIQSLGRARFESSRALPNSSECFTQRIC